MGRFASRITYIETIGFHNMYVRLLVLCVLSMTVCSEPVTSADLISTLEAVSELKASQMLDSAAAVGGRGLKGIECDTTVSRLLGVLAGVEGRRLNREAAKRH